MIRPAPPAGWSVSWSLIGDTTPAREVIAFAGDHWKCTTAYSTPDAALAAARDCDRRARAGEGAGALGRIAVVVRHGLRPRFLIVAGELWGVREDGRLEVRT